MNYRHYLPEIYQHLLFIIKHDRGFGVLGLVMVPKTLRECVVDSYILMSFCGKAVKEFRKKNINSPRTLSNDMMTINHIIFGVLGFWGNVPQ